MLKTHSTRKLANLSIFILGIGILISSLHVCAQTNNGGAAQVNNTSSSITVSNQAVDASVAKEFEQDKKVFKDFRVESVEEFVKLKTYRQQLLSNGKITHSFQTPDGHLIHCIEIASQESIRRAGIDPKTIRFAPDVLPNDGHNSDAHNTNNTAAFGMDGSLDSDGNERSCPKGSIPILIPSIEDLSRFKHFEDRFRKYPATTNTIRESTTNHFHSGLAPPGSSGNEPPSGHEYAHAYRLVNNQGAQADFNYWQPAVQQTDEFSLGQLWVVGGSGTGLQTAETGWQVYYQRYGDWLPHLFIFTTQNGYSLPIQGYYNLDSGTPFVQTDSSVIIAGSISPVSTYGGAQYNVTLTFYRDQGGSHNWWLKYGNTWVGYYPNTWFNSSGLANQGSEVDFGGEIVNDNIGGVHTTTQMGSGHFPSEGFYYSAYVKRINYIDMSGSGQNASGLTRNVTDASLYDLALYYNGDTNLLNYFFFGGPGGSQGTRIISLSGNLAFGNVAVGNSTQNTLTINNTGNSTMTVTSISYPSGFSGNWSGTISAGGSQNVTVTFSPTSATSYGGTVTVNSDKTSGVNTVLASGTGTVVLLPDLTISGSVATSPASVASGGTIQVSWTEKNQGTVASSPAHNTKIFLATSAYGTTYQIGYFGPMNTLGVNATQAYSQPCVVPTTVPTGNYYVTAFVDCDQQVTESSDNNNIGSSSPTTFAVTPLQYTITASAGSGGTVNPNGSFSKNPGDSQTFTAGGAIFFL